VLAVVVACAGCGGRYGKAARPDTRPRGVEAAALPYRIVDARTGREVTESDAWLGFASTRAICIGEEHDNPHHHWAQLRIVDELGKRVRLAGGSLALGMEMFQWPYQGVLDDYAAGKIDDAALMSRTGWADRWGFDFALYSPIFARARTHGAQFRALNPPRELVKKLSREGIEAMTPEERAQLPELVLDDQVHRAWWDSIMSGMGGAHGHTKQDPKSVKPAPPPDPNAKPAPPAPSAERIYAAQVLWDEAMADGATKWIGAGPGRSMIVLAGNGHCHDSAVVARIKRRGIADAISIAPMIDDGQNVAEALAAPMNDFLFVMSMPAPEPKSSKK
jgi:uncharacterized iron-regulated protein